MDKQELIKSIDIKEARRVISDIQSEAHDRFQSMRKSVEYHKHPYSTLPYRDLQIIGDNSIDGTIYDDGDVQIIGDGYVDDTLLSTATDYDDGFGYYHEYYDGSKQLNATLTLYLIVDDEEVDTDIIDIIRNNFDLSIDKTSAKAKSLIIDMINKYFKES